MQFDPAAALLLTAARLSPDRDAAKRYYTAKASFRAVILCPLTGNTHGACPGYVVDDI